MKTPYREVAEKSGRDYKNLWGSYGYLAELACVAAVDVDNYLLRRDLGLESAQEFAEFLEKAQLGPYEKQEDYLESDSTLELTVFHALKKAEYLKEPEKSSADLNQLASEMRTFRAELQDLERLPRERLKLLRQTCLEFSREFSRHRRSFRRDLAA